jgi:hypothetical protein
MGVLTEEFATAEFTVILCRKGAMKMEKFSFEMG